MGSGLAQDQPAGSLGDDIRVQCLAAAVVEHGGAGRQVCADVLRDPAVMHVAMASIDVDRMFRIQKAIQSPIRVVPASPHPAGRDYTATAAARQGRSGLVEERPEAGRG